MGLYPTWDLSTDVSPDYKTLSQMRNLTEADRTVVQRQLQRLPPRIKEAQEREMGEMMGKLKQVCELHDSESEQDADVRSWVMAY